MFGLVSRVFGWCIETRKFVWVRYCISKMRVGFVNGCLMMHMRLSQQWTRDTKISRTSTHCKSLKLETTIQLISSNRSANVLCFMPRQIAGGRSIKYMGNRYMHKVSVVADIWDRKLEPPIFPCAKQGATRIQGPTGPSVVLTVSWQSSHTDLVDSAADFFIVSCSANSSCAV